MVVGEGSLIALVKMAYDYVKDFVNIMFSYFQFDDPRKTLMLSLLVLLGIVSVIGLFSGTSILGDGVTDVSGNSKLGVNGFTGKSLGTAGGIGGATTTTIEDGETPPPQGVQCNKDADCQIINEYGNIFQTKCCNPNEYNPESYFCGGKCLNQPIYGLDACKLPNACGFGVLGVQAKAYIKELPNTCLNYPETHQNSICNDITGETGINSYGGCCNDQTLPCYGFCLKDVAGANCGDVNDCYSEKEVLIISEEAQYI